MNHAGAADTLRPIRRLVLALVLLGTLGFLVELALLGHTESWQQWVPVAALAAGLVVGGAVAVRPSRALLRTFQGVMVVFIGSGLAGLWLHYAGNVEFELEREPDLRGVQLVWESLQGATPALAPGALIQLGLLGLTFAYRHPALARRAAPTAFIPDQETR